MDEEQREARLVEIDRAEVDLPSAGVAMPWALARELLDRF
jgi:hypothetical protein